MEVLDDLVIDAANAYLASDNATVYHRMKDALQATLPKLSPTAEDLGLWTSPDPEYQGWVAMPLANRDTIRVWKRGYGSVYFQYEYLNGDISGDADYHEASYFAVAYFDAHNPSLCKEHCLIGRCTLPEGHESRHKRDVDSITFYWEATVEA